MMAPNGLLLEAVPPIHVPPGALEDVLPASLLEAKRHTRLGYWSPKYWFTTSAKSEEPSRAPQPEPQLLLITTGML